MKKKILILIAIIFLGAAIFILTGGINKCQQCQPAKEVEDKIWLTTRGETDLIKLFSPQAGSTNKI